MPPYVHQEFPKWQYHRDLPARIVHDPDQETALGQGWYDSPAQIPGEEFAGMSLAELAAEPLPELAPAFAPAPKRRK